MIHNGVFFGLTTVDMIHYVPRFPGVNEKLKSERLLSYAGGPAANAAVAFTALGNTSTLITGIGKHSGGMYIKEELNNLDVDVKDYTSQPERPPIMASIIVDLSNGDRMAVYSNTDTRRLKRDASNETLLENKDILMLDGHYLEQAIVMAEKASTLHIPTVLDGGSWKEGEEALLPFIDFAICSADFFPPECSDQEAVIRFLQNHGIQKIAITRGADPVVVVDNSKKTEVPVMKITPMDTLGAGDVFHGAFCHFILQNDYLTSIARAAEIASLSCTSLGTRTWIEQERFI